MMHSDSVVVTVRDAHTGKTFREYDHSTLKTGQHQSALVRVPVPFDTEYKLGIEVKDLTRRRIEFSIDGQDLGALIFEHGYHDLERFIESAERFKFVSKDHGAVTNPTCALNGEIRLKIYREAPPILMGGVYRPRPWTYHDDPNYGWPWNGGSICTTGALTQTNDGGIFVGYSSCNLGAQSGGVSFDSVTLSSQTPADDSQVGATVGGSHSDQTFSTTTWRGDAEGCVELVFRLQGTKTVAKHYCPGCGTKLLEGAAYCHGCGTKV